MSWQERLLSAADLQPFLSDKQDLSFASQVAALIEHQKAHWQSLKEGYEALKKIETKSLELDGSSVVVQHNVKRIRSTAAAVDKASIQARRCFLCAENLPDEEKGIAYDDDYILLCNPFPVLDKHLVIAHRQHVEQKIADRVEALLALARDLGEEYFVLYNGAECGASAPDHFHLQACSRELLPIKDAVDGSELPTEEDCNICADMARGNFELFTLNDFGRSVVVFRGANRLELAFWIYRVIEELGGATGKDEPMINLICYQEKGVWTAMLFPRARHRPACFFAEGKEQIIISPGAVDMAGIIVAPRHEDYERLDAQHVEQIFREVSADAAFVDELIERVCAETMSVEV